MITRRGNQSRIMIPHMMLREQGGFQLSDISGYVLDLDWQDATKLYTDAAKITPVSSDGDVIGAVEDKSGQGNDAIQSTTSKKSLYKINIINSLPVGRFDGINDAMEMPIALQNAKTIFIAGKLNNVPGGGTFMSPLTIKFDASTFSEFLFMNIGGYEEITFMHDYVSGVNGVGIDLTLDTDVHLWSHTYDNSDPELVGSYTAFNENTSKVIANSGALGRTSTDIGSIGGRIDNAGAVTGSSDMDYARIVAYNSVLTSGQYQNVRNLLLNKIGL